MLKEGNSSCRIIITEIIIKNFKHFTQAKINEEFIPPFIEEVDKCLDFSEDWIIANFPLVIQFFLHTNTKHPSTYIKSIQELWKVQFLLKHRER
jgi:hypothetical protein